MVNYQMQVNWEPRIRSYYRLPLARVGLSLPILLFISPILFFVFFDIDNNYWNEHKI